MHTYSYDSHVETKLSINLDSEGLEITGILRGDFSRPVVVIVHGRPGSGNDLLPFLYSHDLYEQGFTSLRLDMYSFMPSSRNLIDSTLDTNADDLVTVVHELRRLGAKKLFLVGHSYGGLAILKAKADVDGVVLWDPTHGLVFSMKTNRAEYGEFVKKQVGDLLITTSGYGLVETIGMKSQDESLGDTTNLASGNSYPIKIISAENGIMTELHKKYIEVAREPKDHTIIKNALHQFTNSDEVISRLFLETTDWFKRYI